MSDAGALAMLLRETKPDEVYNLAAQSHVAVSFVMPKCVCRGAQRVCRCLGLR
jgi:GDP-D-mannose dehydratase